MPIYDYKCSKCGYKFEKFIPRQNGQAIKCEHCGSTTKRLISPVSIIFKGHGFYVTDSKKTDNTKIETKNKELSSV